MRFFFRFCRVACAPRLWQIMATNWRPRESHTSRDLGPVSRKSRDFTGHFRVSQFPFYLKNGEDLSRQTSQLVCFLLPWKHVKRSAFQNKRLAVSQMAFRAQKVFGTFEKRAPGHYLNNRVFLSRNYRLIVAPRKFDVLKTNICPRSEASRANMLVLRTSNFQGATIRPIVPRHKHSIVFIVHH